MDNEKGENTAAKWAFWGTIIGALITGLITLIVAGKIPFLTPTISNEDVFVQNFDGSDGSFDTSIFVCQSPSCNAQNVFQQNGTLVFKFNTLELSSDVWGVYMTSRATWNMENLISIEGNLQISPNTLGGTWLGLNSSAACALFAPPDAETPVVHCDLDSNGTTEYITADVPAKFNTWYSIRIEYDPTTGEQEYFLDNILIGRHTPENSPDTASLSLGAWRQENQSVNAFMDNIVVRTKP